MPQTSRRELVQAGAAALGGLMLPQATSCAEPKPPARAPVKKLIAWGWDTAHPAKIQVNVRRIEELPWDGIVLSHFVANRGGEEVLFEWRCFGQEKFERAHLADTIGVLNRIAFRKFTDNFLRFNVQPGDVDWFDDFGAILHNARLWSEVAGDAGMQGWKFDVEDYTGKVFSYRKLKYAGEKTFAEYEAQVRLRGRQLMEAVQERYPGIVILLSLSHSYVNLTAHASRLLPDLPAYGLLPAFVNGMIEGAGARVKFVDGQEQAYGYLTAEDYFRGYHGVRQSSLGLIPDALRGRYREAVGVGVAVWANYQLAVPVTTAEQWPPHYMMPADRLRLFEQNVYYAMTTADEYAWLYSEQMGWWEPGYPSATPAGAIEAMRNARAKVAGGEPLGFDMAGEVAAARAQMARALRAK